MLAILLLAAIAIGMAIGKRLAGQPEERERDPIEG